MFGIPDPASIAGAIVTGINQFIALRRLNEWIKLILGMVFSFWLSGAFTCGSLMMTRQSNSFSIGSGLVCGAAMATIVFRRSPLTKGMIVALPEKEAEVELNANVQVISKQ